MLPLMDLAVANILYPEDPHKILLCLLKLPLETSMLVTVGHFNACMDVDQKQRLLSLCNMDFPILCFVTVKSFYMEKLYCILLNI
jgi:hypothetical protein